MIKNFKHKGLNKLFETGKSKLVDARLQQRILIRLDVLEEAEVLADLKVPGFNFHPLTGFKPTRYTIHVNGPWCLTFTFDNGKAGDVDLENYHQK